MSIILSKNELLMYAKLREGFVNVYENISNNELSVWYGVIRRNRVDGDENKSTKSRRLYRIRIIRR